MVKNLEKIISYRCFECGEYQESRFTLFDLKSHRKVVCSKCEVASFDISQNHKSYVLNMKCNKCAESHQKQIPINDFWNGDKFASTCENCGYMVCSVGNNSDELIPLKIETYKKKAKNPSEIANSELVMQGFWILQKIIITGNVNCDCGTSSIKVNFKDNGVEINCITCGNKEFFKIENYYDLVKLKNLRSVQLAKKTAKIIQFINN